MVIVVSHRVRVLVRAATLLVAADLAAALRDQPAVEEAKAWAAVASAVGDAAVEAAEEAEVDAEDKQIISLRESPGYAACPGVGLALVTFAAGLSLVTLLTLGRLFGVRR